MRICCSYWFSIQVCYSHVSRTTFCYLNSMMMSSQLVPSVALWETIHICRKTLCAQASSCCCVTVLRVKYHGNPVVTKCRIHLWAPHLPYAGVHIARVHHHKSPPRWWWSRDLDFVSRDLGNFGRQLHQPSNLTCDRLDILAKNSYLDAPPHWRTENK